VREFGRAAARDSRATSLAGCEYSQAYAQEAQRLGVDARVGGMETLGGIEPDVIILSHVVEHFADMPRELARLRGLCGPETLLYVEVPGVMTIHERPQYSFELSQYFTLAHTYHFTLTTLTAAMTRAGFARVYGDEEVRTVFRPAPTGQPPAASNSYAATMTYLQSLHTSRWLHARRLFTRSVHSARNAGVDGVRVVAGEAGVQMLRKVKRGLRGIRP
jgi:hypothetical protein